MIRWFLIVILSTALQISLSGKSDEYFVDEHNGKSHTIIQYLGDYNSPNRLMLNINESSGITKNFNLSTCEQHLSIKDYSINSQRSHLYIRLSGSFNTNYILIVNLTTLSDDHINGKCVFFNAAYFGKYKIYIYRVEDSTILKRWLLTPVGEEINPVVVAETKLPIEYVNVDRNKVHIQTRGNGENSHTIKEEYDDVPKCDVPDDDTSCKEYQRPQATSNVTRNSPEHFVGECDNKNYTITEHYETPNRLVLNVKKSSGIIRKFPLSTCVKKSVTIQKHTLNSQGSRLFLYLWNSHKGKSLVIVNLMTLSNDIDNGNCTFINEIYFGKHKIYIYRVENSTILKRWLVTSDGELTNPVVVTETKLPIGEVDVSIDSNVIKIITWKGNTKDKYVREDHNDLPKCDLPKDDTSCTEYIGAGETPMVMIAEQDLKAVFIVVGALFIVLFLLGVAYFLYKWKLKSIWNSSGHLQRDAHDYVSVPHGISNDDN
ncbi:hypothetical protein FO519_000193 [Halicephalobus sp. NKZ332]|nr:hypothetical protein FO519_000193 [Halicephalobus sp. NKZ332]